MTFRDKAVALARSGRDFPDRLHIKAGGWIDRFSAPSAHEKAASCDKLEPLLADLFSSQYGIQLEADPHMQNLEVSLAERWRDLDGATPFDLDHRGTTTLGRLCYAVCRTLRPRAVIETGIAYGITSAYILAALAADGRGTLQSVDLPPLGEGAEEHVGYLVPPDLRARWQRTRGSARSVLPGVLRQAAPIDVFVHDSLHTYSHMRWEIRAAIAAMHHGGVIIADDIEGNRAFEEAAADPRVSSWVAVRQEGKNAVCGALRIRN
jgi:predicted O-methyltransferase YrrM